MAANRAPCLPPKPALALSWTARVTARCPRGLHGLLALHLALGALRPRLAPSPLILLSAVPPAVTSRLPRSRWVEKLIYVDTKKGLSQELTVLENLLAWLQMKGWSTSKENLIKALRSVDMEKFSNLYISQCSEGLKKRAALARLYFSFIFEVKFWLLDEPSNDLDEKSILLFKELINNFLKTNGTIILTTHDSNLFKRKHEILDLDLLKEKKMS